MKKVSLFALLMTLFIGTTLSAEKSELRISKQYGLAYLPLIVLEEKELIAKHAKAAGLGDVKVEWVTFGGGATANDGLLSGSVDIISGGNAPFIRLWDKTKGKVKALAALDQAPLVLNSANPKVKTLRDLTDKDKIALPAVKVSIQSLVLQIAAAKEFGAKNYDKFDHLTVTLKHPDALIALTSGGKSEITGHLAPEPFLTIEQQNPNIHEVFNSYDVFGGKHTTNVISTTEEFYKNNPKLSQAIIDALNEADAWIAGNKKAAAELYLKAAKSKEPLELIEQILNKPEVHYQTKPLPNITVFSDFLFDTGAIKTKPKSWKELFFDKIY
ncbi:MAG: ABC transporter substrate-binding protein [Campylobacteraceae bacterium]|jgi:NitT/TauT family transport system substrate-binding protein|nr:ABC transporter substrate-binding protein [Campylobacteraceae bacterium]